MARRKRKDPIDVPVDGDMRMDTVINKDPAKAYALVSVDDMQRMVQRGFVRTAKDDPARPMFGGIDPTTGEPTEKIVNGQLCLMEAPIERAEAIQAQGEKEFGRRAKGLRDSIKQHVSDNPGSKFLRATG